MSKTPAERQRESRQRKRDIVTPQNVTDVTKRDIPTEPANISTMSDIGQVTRTLVYDTEAKTIRPTLDHYHANSDKYIPRSEPDKLNWGPWMSSDELSRAGFKANRVSMIGDWDFVGVGVKP